MRVFPTASGNVSFTVLSGLLDGRALRGFKPRRLNQFERAALRRLGWNREIKFSKQPPMIMKSVTDDQCDLCAMPLANLAICVMCGNCVYCGALSLDPHSQNCLTCGNTIPGRSDEGGKTLNTNEIRP